MPVLHYLAASRKAGGMAGRRRNLKAKIGVDGYEYHENFLIRRIETSAGIRFQADLGKISGKYIRRSFKTVAKARACAADRRLELEQHGFKAKSLPEPQRQDAVAALAALEPFGANLQTAAAFYAKHHEKVDRNNGVAHLIDAYLKEQAQRVEDGSLRPRTFKETYKRLKPLCGRLGNLAIDAVDSKDIQQMLSGYKPQNAANYKRYTSMFFRWATRKGKAQRNPVELLDAVKLEVEAPAIYDPRQVRAIMQSCTEANDKKEPLIRMLPYFALAFFAGIRPDEIRRLDWEDIDLRERVIHIRAAVSKTKKARFIEMPGNLVQWLAICPNKGGPVFPWSESSQKRWRAAVYKAADAPGIQDGARHSMATYYLALHTIEETTELLGHSDRVLFRHYKGLVKGRKTKAREYFDIKPCQSAIIDFPHANPATRPEAVGNSHSS